MNTKLAKPSFNRECDAVADSDGGLLDMKRGKNNAVSACIKDFNRSTGV
jgi:hypothetical protein